MLRNNTFRSRVELWRPTVTPKIFLPSKNQFSPYWEQYYPCWKWAISLNLKALPTTTESKGWLAIWLVLGYFCHYHGARTPTSNWKPEYKARIWKMVCGRKPQKCWTDRQMLTNGVNWKNKKQPSKTDAPFSGCGGRERWER